jgi:hypothetical protein
MQAGRHLAMALFRNTVNAVLESLDAENGHKPATVGHQK